MPASSAMQTLHELDDPDAFDRCVGPDIASALARLAAIEHELGGMDRADSVAAMTLTMKLQDERDALYETVASTLLALRAGGEA